MAKHTLKILWCKHRKILKVCLAILQHFGWKGFLKNIINNQELIKKDIFM